MKVAAVFILLYFSIQSLLWAQYPPRIDDHFWRRKVLLRLDLDEKINLPIKEAESALYLPEEAVREGKYEYTGGLIAAIMKAYEKGEIDGYHPDTLTETRSYLRAKKELEKFLPDDAEGASSSSDSESDFGEEGEDEFGTEEEVAESAGGKDDVMVNPSAGAGTNELLYRPLKTQLDIIEDRIFDKNKSSMYYDLQWIIFKAIDPYGKIPNKPIVAFRYKDLMPYLNATQWKNRFNDAEYRSLQEIFELRLFNGTIINVSSDKSVKTLYEAYKRAQQIVEFEHHLWEF
ncbi:MAG: hypothetical protein RML72_01400 [Bacteroidia bacterium]|nr:hypothetical protein [Bacteroidia bacterium]MDW8157514.1 hypothetical protein [Bacteroidia bacterium]